jgi:hypothetical protein
MGPADAEIVEKEFSPEIKALYLLSLPNDHIYLKLMLDGTASRPFGATTLSEG